MANRPPQFPQQPGQQPPFAQRPGPPQKSNGNKTLFMILGIVGGVVLLTVCVCGGFILWGVMQAKTVVDEAVQEARTEMKSAAGRNNLRSIGLAFHNYHNKNRNLPLASYQDASGKEQSWRTAINEMAGNADPNLPPALRSKAGAALFHSPTDPGNPNDTSYMAVVDENTAIARAGEEPISFSKMIDGTSNIAIVIEVHNTGQPWDKPGDVSIDEAIKIIQSSPTGTTNVLLADGMTIPVSKNASSEVLRNLFTINDKQALDFSEFSK